jgi:hypothetical protein
LGNILCDFLRRLIWSPFLRTGRPGDQKRLRKKWPKSFFVKINFMYRVKKKPKILPAFVNFKQTSYITNRQKIRPIWSLCWRRTLWRTRQNHCGEKPKLGSKDFASKRNCCKQTMETFKQSKDNSVCGRQGL